MVGSQWKVYEQTTLPNGALNFYPAAHATTMMGGGGVEFLMPDALPAPATYVNYLMDNFRANLTESDTITAMIDVAASSSSVIYVGNPDGECPGSSLTLCPGAVRLFIQSNLPASSTPATCVGPGYNKDNYWWSNPIDYPFAPGSSPGEVTLSVPLNPDDWSNLCGEAGSLDPADFDAAIGSIKHVGLSFGSGFFFSNGLGVDGSTGNAIFELISYGL